MKSSEDKTLTSEEIDARREAGLKKLLATPPKPHKAKAKKPKADAVKTQAASRNRKRDT